MRQIVRHIVKQQSRLKVALALACALVCALFLFQNPEIQAETPPEPNPIIDGLYIKKCGVFDTFRYLKIEKVRGRWDTTEIVITDSVECRLIPISSDTNYKNIKYCDTVKTNWGIIVDSTIAQRFYRQDEFGEYRWVDSFRYDTTYLIKYEITCHKVDTVYHYDTITNSYTICLVDTASSSDTLILINPFQPTDTTFEFCPHINNVYNPYAELIRRYGDSIAAWQTQLAAMESTWPAGLRQDKSPATYAAELADATFTPDPLLLPEENDSIKQVYIRHLTDSLRSIPPLTPDHLRAKIGAYQGLIDKYKLLAYATQEYHIDSVNVVAKIHLKGGGLVSDTITVRTIPLLYEKLPDTAIRQDSVIPVWVGSPRIPKTGNGHYVCYGDACDTSNTTPPDTTYVTIRWEMPIKAATGVQFKPKHGFDTNTLVLLDTTKTLTDPIHLATWVAELVRGGAAPDPSSIPEGTGGYAARPLQIAGGNPQFKVRGPLYRADTTDGDTLLFPIHVKATTQNMKRFPAPPPYMCEYTDTIKIAVIKGFRVSGYVSYAGLWFPSKAKPVPDTKSKNVAKWDGDLEPEQLRHLPVNGVDVYLISLPGRDTVATATSGPDGYFAFDDSYPAGQYEITGSSPQKKTSGGVYGLNVNDASWVLDKAAERRDLSTLPEITNPELSMWWWASNADLSIEPKNVRGLNVNDATAILDKAAERITAYYNLETSEVLDDWQYSIDTLDLQEDTMFHVRGVMRGDADRNYFDTLSEIEMQRGKGPNNRFKKDFKESEEAILVNKEERFIDFPVISEDSGYLKGLQVFFHYQYSKLEPLGVEIPPALNLELTYQAYNDVNNKLLTFWVTEENHYFHVGDTLMVLNLHLKSKPTRQLPSYFQNDIWNFVASDTNAQIIPWQISLPALELFNPGPEYYNDSTRWDWEPLVEEGDTVYEIPDNETALVAQGKPSDEPSHIISVIPNPIVFWGDVTYYVHESSLVNLKLYSLVGKNVLTFVEAERQLGLYRLSMNMQTLPSGVYILRLETSRLGKTEFDIAKIVIKR